MKLVANAAGFSPVDGEAARSSSAGITAVFEGLTSRNLNRSYAVLLATIELELFA